MSQILMNFQTSKQYTIYNIDENNFTNTHLAIKVILKKVKTENPRHNLAQ